MCETHSYVLTTIRNQRYMDLCHVPCFFRGRCNGDSGNACDDQRVAVARGEDQTPLMPAEHSRRVEHRVVPAVRRVAVLVPVLLPAQLTIVTLTMMATTTTTTNTAKHSHPPPAHSTAYDWLLQATVMRL